MSCNDTGCGIDDQCSPDQTCQPLDDPKNTTATYQCFHKNLGAGIGLVYQRILFASIGNQAHDGTVELTNGRKYSGEVNVAKQPHGNGTEYYENQKTEYVGEYLFGLKDGNGTFSFENGIKGYEGHFSKGLMDGPGLMYYEKSGVLLFRGTFRSGNFYNGTLFAEDGTKLKDVLPTQESSTAPTPTLTDGKGRSKNDTSTEDDGDANE